MNQRYEAYVAIRATNSALPPKWLKPWEKLAFTLRYNIDQRLPRRS